MSDLPVKIPDDWIRTSGTVTLAGTSAIPKDRGEPDSYRCRYCESEYDTHAGVRDCIFNTHGKSYAGGGYVKIWRPEGQSTVTDF